MKSIFLFVLCFFSFVLNAQLLEKKGGCLMYEDVLYCKSYEKEYILSYNLKALPWYLKSRKSLSKANLLGYSSVFGIGFGALFVRLNQAVQGNTLGSFGLFIGVIASAMGLAGISAKSESKKEMKRAIDIFNGASFSKMHRNRSFEVTLQSRDLGVALVIGF